MWACTIDTVPTRYYRKGKRIDGTYPCLNCSYGDNKTCSMCVFAKWNVEGVMAGFSPKEAHRQAHSQDISASPMMQTLAKKTPLDMGSPHNTALPPVHLPFFPVPTYNSISESLRKLQAIRRKIS